MIQKSKSMALPQLFTDAHGVTEFHLGAAPCLLSGDAACHVVSGLVLEIGFALALEVRVLEVPAKESA